MIKSVVLRTFLVLALAGLTWMLLAGWATDSPRDRLMEASISAVVALGAIGIALPARAAWALRFVAGIVGVVYLLYFGAELWSLVSGQRQILRLGEPSATMAGLGLLFIGLPLLVFALSGTGILKHLARGHSQTRSSGDGPPAV